MPWNLTSYNPYDFFHISCQSITASFPLQRPAVLQRRGVGGDLVFVFGQLHLVRGEGPAAVRIAVHFDDGALEAEVIGHLQADREPILRDKHTLW